MNEESSSLFAELALSPEGHIYCCSTEGSEALYLDLSQLFLKDAGYALLHLGLRDFTMPLSDSCLFWRSFSRQFITRVCCLQREIEQNSAINLPTREEMQGWLGSAPCMKGIEYLSEEVFMRLWQQMQEALNQELKAFPASLQEYLQQYSPCWNQVGRVCFHLAENKNNTEKPFAFLATYTANAAQQHLPLKRALQESIAKKEQSALLSLLLPVQKAALLSPFVKKLVDSGAIFEAAAWGIQEAHRFLQDIPLMQSSGVLIRVPNWWNPQRPPRVKAELHIGKNSASLLGLNSLLDFTVQLAYGGESLTEAEWREIQQGEGSLIKIKGQWVEVDRTKLDALLSQWNQLKKLHRGGLPMAEGLRLLAGINPKSVADEGSSNALSAEWFQVTVGSQLQEMLEQIRHPRHCEQLEEALSRSLRATLRAYQQKGVQWLWTLYQLRLGGCLADDMGLGKTIQVLSLLVVIKDRKATDKPHLLIVPASLLGNWQAEAARFAPGLKLAVAHSSSDKQEEIVDLVITTYGYLQRSQWLQQTEWNLLILDEAQAIKNPQAKQTLAVKGLKSDVRLALTGTPVENRLSDLWSLFDFTSPGLLGSAKVFADCSKQGNRVELVTALRKLTQPYLLRRLKSDKSIVPDLPPKTEIKAYCYLSKLQIRLYTEAMDDLKQQLERAEGIKRRGLILALLIRLKQICNHPVQWLGFGEFAEKESGKLSRLREICEEIAEKQEKVLIFTQFTEIIEPLFVFLTEIFGRKGLMLHGKTPIEQRAALVDQFQQDRGPPFFLLSLKAGGTGLNLTKASHVIHFDRWWNPAVENQATDRAYRIGQGRPVLVHQFICSGTIEEKIDALIESKKSLSKELLEGQGEVSLTEMSNEQVLQLVSLDIKRAMREE